MQTSNCGRSVLITSPSMTSNFLCSGVPCTRFVTSAAIRGSNSTHIHFFARSRMRTVRLPVPGPTSRTVSVGLRYAFSTMASETPGFLRMCWPTFVLNLKTVFLFAAAPAWAPFPPLPPAGRSYGVLEALPRLTCFVLAMLVECW